jgi:ABC-type xylose transport system substrate-binding protein
MAQALTARRILLASAAALLLAAPVQADDLVCKGDITSVQGEGLVKKTHRFEVAGVTGTDVMAVLERCKKIALERQNVAARKNPGGNFTATSVVDLQCVKGSENIAIRRTIRTR